MSIGTCCRLRFFAMPSGISASPWTHRLDWVVVFVEGDALPEDAETAALVELAVQTGGDRFGQLEELVLERHADALRRAELEAIFERTGDDFALRIQDRRWGKTGAAEAPVERQGCFSALLEGLADELLLLHRPLRAWSSRFFVPFEINDRTTFSDLRRKAIDAAKRGGGVEFADVRDEERFYFGTDARKAIVPEVKEILAYRKKSDEDGGGSGDVDLDRRLLVIEIAPERLTMFLDKHVFEGPKELPFRCLRLYFFYAECAALEWGFGGEHAEDGRFAEREARGDLETAPAFWPLLFREHGDAEMTIGDLLDTNQAARAVYGAFQAEARERFELETLQRLTIKGVCQGQLLLGAKPSEEIAGWFDGLLRYSFAAIGDGVIDPAKACRLLIDERARVVTSAVPFGGVPETEAGRARFRALLTRFQTVERAGEGHAYDGRVAIEDLEAGYYRRFADFGSHYLLSEQGFAFLGFGDYARSPVHDRHMAGNYARMARLTQFYAAIMRAFQASARRGARGVAAGERAGPAAGRLSADRAAAPFLQQPAMVHPAFLADPGDRAVRAVAGQEPRHRGTGSAHRGGRTHRQPCGRRHRAPR